MTAIVDYGVGNLFSLRSSFGAVGEEAAVTSDRGVIMSADRVVLPGVGAFADAARKLSETGLGDVIKEAAGEGIPLLGICLGMQLLFERSFEYGEHAGLGLLQGEVRPIAETVPEDSLSGLKIPHMGWNSLDFDLKDGKCHPLFKYIKNGDYVYFVHSYCAVGCESSRIASSFYGAPLTAAAARDNVAGCQFHPEKSGRTGLSILRAFCETRRPTP